MTIRVVYDREPPWPPTDQHPQAQRIELGGFWVDYVGSAPTLAEVQALLAPPPDLRASARAAIAEATSQQGGLPQIKSALQALADLLT